MGGALLESHVEKVWLSRQLAQSTDVLTDRFPGGVAVQSELGGFTMSWASIFPLPRVSSWARRGGGNLELLQPLVVFDGGGCATWGLGGDVFLQVPRGPVFFCGLSFSFTILSLGEAGLGFLSCGGERFFSPGKVNHWSLVIISARCLSSV